MVSVHACPLTCTLKGLFMESWTAGSHHQAIQTIFFDILLNHLLAGIRTHELVISGDRNVLKTPRKFRYLLNIHLAGNVHATMADIKSNSVRHHSTSLDSINGVLASGS